MSAKACSAQAILARRRTPRTLTPAASQADTSIFRSIFVDDLEIGRAFKLLRSHGEGFDNECSGRRKIGEQFRMGRHQPDITGIEPSYARSNSVAPACKIRLVGRHESGKRGPPLLRRTRIKHHADQTSP